MISMPRKRSVYIAGLLFAFYNANSFGEDNRIAERVTRMAEIASGGEVTVIAISRLPDYPGMTQATKIVYKNALGMVSELIMLPDGEHFIPAGVMSYVPMEEGAAEIPATPTRVQAKAITPTVPAYTVNDILGIEDFAPEVVQGLFESASDTPEVYFGILADAPAVIEGTGKTIYYVMFDPACPYCLRKYQALRPLIESGKITVHWIPTVGPSKPPYDNLLILADQTLDNQTRLGHLARMASRELVTQIVGNPEAAIGILSKTGMVRQMLRSNIDPARAAGTPQGFYRLADGRIRHHYGYRDDQIVQLTNDVN